MDEVYRGYRIATKENRGWTARVTHVRGPHLRLGAKATIAEGEAKCFERARSLIDHYIAFLALDNRDGEPT